MEIKRKKSASLNRFQRNRKIYYCCMMALPILQFIVFYIYINLNSFVMGFQEWSFEAGTYTFNGIANFKQIFQDFKYKEVMQYSLTNSFRLFGWSLVFGSFLAVLFSYYIYKQNFGSTVFKILLYLPQILGGVVVVIMFKYFVDIAIPEIADIVFDKNIKGMLENSETRRFTVIFFTIYGSFGTQILVYSSAMSGISDSIIESAQLDGATPMREFLSIVLPSIWSTFITFMVSSVIAIFTNQMSLFTMYGDSAEPRLSTFGYHLYRLTVIASNADYPYLSAMGLLMTCVAVPMTLFTRWSLKKFGPSKD